MTAPLVLGLLALVLMTLGQYVVAPARWPERAPRLAMAVWQALAFSALASLLLVCVALILPGMSVAATVGEIGRACLVELRQQYSTVAGGLVSSVGIVLTAVLAGRVAIGLLVGRRTAAQARRGHLEGLSLVAEESGDGSYTVPHGTPAVYCVPGQRRREAGTIVVTTGARAALSRTHLALVLRHERAHLSARHDRLVRRSGALAAALPWIPFFAVAHAQIARLAEMHADDAVNPADRLRLAEALYELAAAGSTSAGGGGSPRQPEGLLAPLASAPERAVRLLGPRRPLRAATSGLLAVGVAVIALAPATAAFVPSTQEMTMLAHHCCNQGPTP